MEFCCINGIFLGVVLFFTRYFFPVTEKLCEKHFRKKHPIQSKQDFLGFGPILHAGTMMEKNILSTKEHRAAVSSCHSSTVQAPVDYFSCADGKKIQTEFKRQG